MSLFINYTCYHPFSRRNKSQQTAFPKKYFPALSKLTFQGFLNQIKKVKKVLKSVCFVRDCNGTRTHNQLSCKRTFNHLAKLAKWLSCFESTYLYGAFNCLYGVSVWHYIGCGFTLKCVRDMIRTYSQCLFYVKYHINRFRGNSIATFLGAFLSKQVWQMIFNSILQLHKHLGPRIMSNEYYNACGFTLKVH